MGGIDQYVAIIVMDELSAFKVTDVRTPRPEGSIQEDDIAADQ